MKACCGALLAGATLAAACDPLLEHPRVPRPALTIVAPQDGDLIRQPGRAVSIEVEVERCKRPLSLDLRVAEQTLPAPPRTEVAPGRYRLVAPVEPLLRWALPPPEPGAAWLVPLRVRLLCADYGQEAESDGIGFSLLPFAALDLVGEEVHTLEPGQFPETLVALSFANLSRIAYHERGRAEVASVNYPSARGLARAAMGMILFAAECTNDLDCPSPAMLFGLDWQTLAPGFRFPLPCLPADVAPGGRDRTLAILSCEPGSAPVLRALAPDGVATDVALAVTPLPPIRVADAAVTFLGAPRPGGLPDLQLVQVDAAGRVAYRSLGVNVFAEDALSALTEDSAFAAVLDLSSGVLHRTETASAAEVTTRLWSPADWPLPAARQRAQLAFADNGDLLVIERDGLVRVDPAGAVRWRWPPPGDQSRELTSVAPLPGDRAAVLAQDLDLIVLDAGGTVLFAQGPLPAEWRPGSRLLDTRDGCVHYSVLSPPPFVARICP